VATTRDLFFLRSALIKQTEHAFAKAQENRSHPAKQDRLLRHATCYFLEAHAATIDLLLQGGNPDPRRNFPYS
jgi:hypothetical protein